MALLQKMGWREGEGLGKLGMGDLEPLKLDVKIDRRGECVASSAPYRFTSLESVRFLYIPVHVHVYLVD